MPAPQLRSPRLILRHWTPEDQRPFALMNSDPEVMRYFPSRLSADQSDLYAEMMQLGLEERNFGFWAIELRAEDQTGGPFIGCAGLSCSSMEFTVHAVYRHRLAFESRLLGNGLCK